MISLKLQKRAARVSRIARYNYTDAAANLCQFVAHVSLKKKMYAYINYLIRYDFYCERVLKLYITEKSCAFVKIILKYFFL